MLALQSFRSRMIGIRLKKSIFEIIPNSSSKPSKNVSKNIGLRSIHGNPPTSTSTRNLSAAAAALSQPNKLASPIRPLNQPHNTPNPFKNTHKSNNNTTKNTKNNNNNANPNNNKYQNSKIDTSDIYPFKKYNTSNINSSMLNDIESNNSLYRKSMERDACGVGLICNINKKASRKIVEQSNEMLVNMEHRGGTGVCVDDGDGAGLLCGIPDLYFHKQFEKLNLRLPSSPNYGVGNIFFGHNTELNNKIKKLMHQIIEKEFGYNIITFRKLPTNNTMLGDTSKKSEPIIEQIFIENTKNVASFIFESKLLLLRHMVSSKIRELLNLTHYFYICSLSSKTIVYKGQFTATQLFDYYLDLQDSDFTSHFALVHSRYSTNTQPSWERAQPNRVSCHNGEINTLRGNKNWMHARQGISQSNWYGSDTKLMFPICNDYLSDSGNFDNVLELLTKASDDRNLPESMITMIPEAWQNPLYSKLNPDPTIGNVGATSMAEAANDGSSNVSDGDSSKQKMYEYLSCVMEPWDGPALMAFCDGNYIGATLDRNGLRPSRYYITNENNLIFASECGVLPNIEESSIIYKNRLEPGKILLVDFKKEKLISDNELKQQLAHKLPYKEWIDENLIYLKDLVKKNKQNNDAAAASAASAASDNPYANYDINSGSAAVGNSSSSSSSSDDKEVKTFGLDFELTNKLNCFGFTTEIVQYLLIPMIMHGKESLGSMGNDASLAILSNHPKLPFEYFKQLFAQVTNPPIDPIRERIVMSLRAPVGPEQNLFAQTSKHCQRIMIENPILTISGMDVLKNINTFDLGNEKLNDHWKSSVLDCTFDAYSGKDSLIERINEICFEASYLIQHGGTNIIILSDKLVSKDRFPVPSLLSLGAIHHYLIHKQLRSNVALFVECGDAKEVHDFCTLIGYGADGICPYMAYQLFEKLESDGMIPKSNINTYRDAIVKGILKVLSKMGVSTLQGYKGAQVFEAVGLHDEVINKCFRGTESRIGGANFEDIYNDIVRLHEYGYVNDHLYNRTNENNIADNITHISLLRNPGTYHFRDKEEFHFNTPETITSLQNAVRLNSQDMYDRYVHYSNEQASRVTLRGLLDFNYDSINRSPITNLDNVEPIENIMRRFNTGAMSLGSISKETHETLAEAMNQIGGRSNTGEGGEDPKRLINKDIRSSIKQVASGRFGVTINYLANSDQIQIKIAQGAKPGEGGELPGNKVNDYIGRMRYTTPGVGLISPPPHHDIYSIEDLSQLIFDLKQCNPTAEISVKLVSEIGVGIVAAGVAKAKANHITVSGHDGGTGASAWTGIKYAGLPWELGIAEVQQTLIYNQLRDRVKLQTDGQLKTARDVIIAALLGAEEYGFATAPLIALGCIMMRKCHLNTCPVGIATQDEELRKKFAGEPTHVINFFYFLANEIRAEMANLGFESMDQFIGRSDYLMINEDKLHGKAKHVDLRPLLISNQNQFNTHKIPYEDNKLDPKLIDLCKDILDNDSVIDNSDIAPVRFENIPIINSHRTAGARLSYEITKKFGEYGLNKDNVVTIHLNGYAGQSFGMCLIKGVTFLLEGDSNDYVGKSLSGGIVAVYPSRKAKLIELNAHNNVIAGNACLYGATSGAAYICGQAGERFGVRNSGANAVVEGVGNHGCEYMTGGRVIVLGRIGINFAAGMSGGIAYVLNPKVSKAVDKELYDDLKKELHINPTNNKLVSTYINNSNNSIDKILSDDLQNYRINSESINVQTVNEDDVDTIKQLLSEHIKYTQSVKGKKVLSMLENGKSEDIANMFAKIMPIEYEKILLAAKAKE